MEEQHLIEGLIKRDKIVFDFIFNYYYSGLCAYAELIVRDQKAAEDVVQDFFISLWIKHNNIQVIHSLKHYLFASVKNRSIDFIRKENNKLKQISANHNKEKAEKNLSLYWFAESELQAELNKSLEKLPKRCSEIFRLSRFEGLKNQEIADKLNISKRTVELQISNALKQLRKDFKPYLPTFLILVLLK